MYSNKLRFLALIVALFALFSGSRCFAQIGLEGIGLSGSETSLVRAVTYEDTVYVVATFSTTLVPVVGIAVDSLRNRIRLFYYATPLPEADPVGSQLIFIPTVQMQDTSLHFKIPLTELLVNYRSVQIEMGLWGVLGTDTIYSPLRTSHLQVGPVPPLRNSVDGRHATFLAVDLSTLPPQILSPDSGQTVSRSINITYFQPEIAESGSLFLQITDHDTNSFESHVFYIRNRTDGQKAITLNALSLIDTSQFSSVIQTSASLRNNVRYDFAIYYQDTILNTAAGDVVESVLVDTRTEPVQLISPTLGSFATYPNIRVIYDLGESAQYVRLVFREDTSATKRDTLLSPHIITLNPQWNSAGQTNFFLNGRDIGTRNSEYVQQSNRGQLDSLRAQSVYFVTISYVDSAGNSPATDSTWGYVWPADSTTIRPVVYEPRNLSAQNQNFWIRFKLPEEPAPGSIRLQMSATGDPGSPHVLYLKLIPAGITGTFLNGNQLDHSVLVDSIGSGLGSYESRNHLLDNTPYTMILSYRDVQNNPSVEAVPYRTIRYDITTRPVVMSFPQDSDTLQIIGTPIQFRQDERAAPNTLKLTLTWTSGPAYDPLSPHILYLSNRFEGSAKTLNLLPSAPASTVGIDSANNDGPLIARSRYALTVSYRDSLLNPEAITQVANLLVPSGTSVFANGGAYGGNTVAPGTTRNPVFKCTLRSLSGISILQAMHFLVQGDIAASDLAPGGIELWSSVDSSFDSNLDTTRLAVVQTLTGSTLNVSGFASSVTEAGSTFFLTLSYRTTANRNHQINLLLVDPSAIDCGGDPILSSRWPIGTSDVPLNADLLSLTTEQDVTSGSLIIQWEVASEYDNGGYNLYRRTNNQAVFQNIASYTNSPELIGHGTSTTGLIYHYTDRTVTPGTIYLYQLESVSISGVSRLYDSIAVGTPLQIPLTFSLGSAFPNPFNQSVTIEYVVPYTVGVKLVVYDLMGRTVKTLVDNTLPASVYHTTWDSKNEQGLLVPSGVYFYRMETDQGFFKTRKMLLIR